MERLLTVCRAAGHWVSDPRRVGAWAVTPQPELNHATPAVMVRKLGEAAVASLVENMARIAPRERVAPEVPDLSVEALRATLNALGTPVIAPAEAVADIDLSDFDD
ncbi:MAG: hypothetical protein ACRDL0_01685 [Thermoleophilaceae bacterium]